MLLKLFCICTLGVVLAKGVCRRLHQDNTRSTDITLRVYHYKVPCIGESVQLCYKVEQQIGNMEYFYDAIEGFRYEWGYNYTLLVEKKRRQSDMADGSSFTYTLKKILTKEKAASEETFELPLRIDNHTLLEQADGKCRYFGNIPVETGAYTCNDLANAATGVFRHRAGTAGLMLVTLK